MGRGVGDDEGEGKGKWERRTGGEGKEKRRRKRRPLFPWQNTTTNLPKIMIRNKGALYSSG